MYPWESPEWVTAVIQMPSKFEFLTALLATSSANPSLSVLVELILSNLLLPFNLPSYFPTYGQFEAVFMFTGHFKPHLSIGGRTGDDSRTWTANECV